VPHGTTFLFYLPKRTATDELLLRGYTHSCYHGDAEYLRKPKVGSDGKTSFSSVG
jgi:hypothetical protein